MLSTEIVSADGVVRGRAGRRIARWRALPYAAPPIGALRLRAPQPVRPWTGVRSATEFGFAAVQNPNGARTGPRTWQPTGEDCLTLNVTAPAHPSSTPRPVMVFFHGGGYLIGTSSMYSGARLAARGDVIVVSVNYRLGALGYVDFSEFSTPERPFESNLGLRDQVAALEWVRRNIAAFGGDPGNVTIFGESAGAHAVVSLLATPAAEGLFHRAIAQSAPADWTSTPAEARRFARRCLDRLGATPADAATVLSTVSAKELCRAGDRALGRALREEPGSFPYAPVADGDFLPEIPLEAIAAGRAHPVPLIIGTNRDEATLFQRFAKSVPHTPAQLKTIFERYEPGTEQAVTSRYPGYPAARTAVRIGGDHLFLRPTLAVLEGHSRYAPTYAYRYDYAPRALHLAGFGATHALDLVPVFGWVDGPVGRAMTAAGGRRAFLAVQDHIQDNWLSFARTGRPLSPWTPYTAERRTTAIIDHPPRVLVDPESARREAWQGIRKCEA
ncbi:carboxylesterase/lipase family protein [Nocardia fluminea]|uniref:Carboxylic ester hydrolase n=1 Tax=Nocardia fluminea TaxID=134984 RepID=A0A2N3VL44_9NOCA|nr:carboxylesterase/lipase family protein [Nocardia fluminea]PKV82340.1 para-nitrobenzyl esterase [Nocardia fluminea]